MLRKEDRVKDRLVAETLQVKGIHCVLQNDKIEKWPDESELWKKLIFLQVRKICAGGRR